MFCNFKHNLVGLSIMLGLKVQLLFRGKGKRALSGGWRIQIYMGRLSVRIRLGRLMVEMVGGLRLQIWFGENKMLREHTWCKN